MTTKPPFHFYSSYNKRGGRQHPLVARRMNQVLDLYFAATPIEAISDHLDIPLETVRSYIRRAKRRGDMRAVRGHKLNRKTLLAHRRRIQMKLLSEAGFTPAEIAKHLECTRRLVQIRLKEANDG